MARIFDMKRLPSCELLDSDAGTPEEVAGALRDLRSLNLRFGGVTTTRALVERVARVTGCRALSLLDVASGQGFVPQTVRDGLRKKSGIRLDLTLLDRVASHLPRNGVAPKLAADVLHLPFRDSAFDLVSCSLFVHHLSPDDAAAFAREAMRVCRTAVLVNDLVRDPIHLLLAYAGSTWYRSRITRNDAPASVRQAYTAEEMTGLFRSAGAAEIETRAHFLYRMGVIAWKKA